MDQIPWIYNQWWRSKEENIKGHKWLKNYIYRVHWSTMEFQHTIFIKCKLISWDPKSSSASTTSNVQVKFPRKCLHHHLARVLSDSFTKPLWSCVRFKPPSLKTYFVCSKSYVEFVPNIESNCYRTICLIVSIQTVERYLSKNNAIRLSKIL